MTLSIVIDLARLALEIATAIVIPFLGWVWWHLRREMVTRAELQRLMTAHTAEHDDIKARLSEGDRRFATILSDIKHLPDHKDLSEMMDRIGGVEAAMAGLGATVEGVKEVLERVERPLNILIEHQLTQHKLTQRK